ncbi:MAG: hypothetical protein KC464_28855, partial [Myxococcales bacterium]|nr:hypothetical protein [Myxococcales bacterium]
IAAVAALVVRTGWLWTRAPRVAAVHATFGVLVAAVAALGVILWTHAFGLRSVAQRRQDDWLPTFVEAGVEVASPLRTWPLVVCLIVVALAMVFGQDAAGMIARTGDLQAHNVDDYGRPGTSAIDMLRATTVLTAIAVGCLALTTWLSRLGQARRLRALLLARPDAPAGGWQLLDGTVASSRGDGPPARHVRGTELDSKGRGLWGNERAQSQAFVLHAGGEAIQIEDGATWASAFASGRPVELETKVGSYYEDILEVPTGARVLLAGRVDRGGDVPTVRHTGTGSIVMFATAAGGAGLAGLRRRLRVHAATPWIALAMVAGIVIAAAVGR